MACFLTARKVIIPTATRHAVRTTYTLSQRSFGGISPTTARYCSSAACTSLLDGRSSGLASGCRSTVAVWGGCCSLLGLFATFWQRQSGTTEKHDMRSSSGTASFIAAKLYHEN